MYTPIPDRSRQISPDCCRMGRVRGDINPALKVTGGSFDPLLVVGEDAILDIFADAAVLASKDGFENANLPGRRSLRSRDHTNRQCASPPRHEQLGLPHFETGSNAKPFRMASLSIIGLPQERSSIARPRCSASKNAGNRRSTCSKPARVNSDVAVRHRQKPVVLQLAEAVSKRTQNIFAELAAEIVGVQPARLQL